jgi:hypothetical protein
MDPTASAHQDPAIAAGCRSAEKTYALMEPSTYRQPAAGRYVRTGPLGEFELVVPAGCDVPARLEDVKSVIAPASFKDALVPVIRAEEGDVCSAWRVEQKDADTVEVKWLPPNGSVAKDPEIVSGCQAFDGAYRRR